MSTALGLSAENAVGRRADDGALVATLSDYDRRPEIAHTHVEAIQGVVRLGTQRSVLTLQFGTSEPLRSPMADTAAHIRLGGTRPEGHRRQTMKTRRGSHLRSHVDPAAQGSTRARMVEVPSLVLFVSSSIPASDSGAQAAVRILTAGRALRFTESHAAARGSSPSSDRGVEP